METSRASIIRASAWIGAALVLAQITIYIATGVGQDPLQFYHSPAEYMQLLLQNPSALRAVMAFDNMFVMAFSTLFVALTAITIKSQAPSWLPRSAHALLLLVGLLDMTENFHFLSMLQAAEHGLAPSAGEISFQVWESLFKFHVGYLGVLLLSFTLPQRSAGERALTFAMRWVNVPVGVLIYCVPQPIATPLLFARFGFFLYSLVAVGMLFGAESRALGEKVERDLSRAAADSSAPA